jgi:hypothetical protein
MRINLKKVLLCALGALSGEPLFASATADFRCASALFHCHFVTDLFVTALTFRIN